MKTNLLDHIQSPTDLRKLNFDQLPLLAKEIRELIITVVAKNEGHLGSSLGVVELTIALHYLFDTPNDLLVWDVGHQAYGHKILTQRKEAFANNRQINGISGFPKPKESVYDTFGVGHSSTSISAALGMALASGLQNNYNKNHIAVIGDASIASGMAFEGLNHAGVTNANLWVILNDNSIGIDPSVGALKNYLTAIKEAKIPKDDNIIKALNFAYSGPIDGHDFNALFTHINELKKSKGPKFLHIVTTKGKGLQIAEDNQVKYHAPGKFDALTGKTYPKDDDNLPPKFQDVFGLTLVELAKTNKNIVGITPAMPSGSSMQFMMDAFPDRAFDVGIAEQHAVTLAAGMATQGLVVYCNIYSTFIQRAYDQVIHDVAIQNLPVIFCLDRAGLVGQDGATHHGVFDIAFLNCIPNLILFAPINEIELRNILYTAQLGLCNPIAIRYPRGRGTTVNWQLPFEKIKIGNAKLLQKGNTIAILSTGTIGNNVISALDKISNKNLFSHYHFPFIKPLDQKQLHTIGLTYQAVITIEEGCTIGGFGTAILNFFSDNNYKIACTILGISDNFIEHGTVAELQKIAGLDPDTLKEVFTQKAETFL